MLFSRADRYGTGQRRAPSLAVREIGPTAAPKPRLLDRVREAIRARHYSRRTEKTYVGWTRRYILFHGKRHPAEMGAAEVTRFLTSLAWLDDPDYSHRVLQYLGKRDEKGNPIPHVVGLGAVIDGASLTLSTTGRRHYKALATLAGADQVHLIAVEARRLGSGGVDLVSQRVDVRASNSSSRHKARRSSPR